MASEGHFAWSTLDGYTIELRGFRNASDDMPIVTVTMRGPNGGSQGVRWLNPGHVEQLERALERAKADSLRA